MFTKMQKYHKAFLIAVTVIIATSFGMGSVCMRLANRSQEEVIATFSAGEIKLGDFREAKNSWDTVFHLAERISTKACYLLKRGYLKNPPYESELWDSIYSLREDVVAIEMAAKQEYLNALLNDTVIEGTAQSVYLKRQTSKKYYDGLKDTQKGSLAGPISDKNIYTLMMLLAEAKLWKIDVSESEITEFMQETQRAFPNAQAYHSFFTKRRIQENQFRPVAKDVLMVLKYLKLRCAISHKVGMNAVYETYADNHSKYRLQWISIKPEKVDYEKEKLAFYEEKIKENPDYFKTSAKADFEYVHISIYPFLSKVKVAEADIQAEYKKQQAGTKDVPEMDRTTKSRIRFQLMAKGARSKAKEYLEKLRKKILELGSSVSLEAIANQEKFFTYKKLEEISEEKILKEKQVNSAFAQKYLYNTKDEKISGVLPDAEKNENGYVLIQILKRVPAKKLTKEDVLKNDDLFLRSYYKNNKAKLMGNYKCRLYAVVLDYDVLNRNLLVPTSQVKEFYKKYKDHLYRINPKEKVAKYIPFEKVKDKLRKTVVNYYRLKELQKIHFLLKIYKDKGKDANLKNIVIASQKFMQVPGCLKYTEIPESPRWMSFSEMRKHNPTGDPNYFPEFQREKMQVKDAPNGNRYFSYFDYQISQAKDFELMREEVKEHFLNQRSEAKARKVVENLRRKYVQEVKDKNLAKQRGKLFKAIAYQEKLKIEEKWIDRNDKKAKEILNYFQGKYKRNVTNLSQIFVMEKAPFIVESKGLTKLMFIAGKKKPAINEIPRFEWDRVRRVLQKRNYNARLLAFLKFDNLKMSMNFKMKKEEE